MRSHQGRVDRRAVCHARARVSWGAHGHVARANRSPPSHLKPYQAEYTVCLDEATEPLATELDRNPDKAPDVNELRPLFMLLDQESVPLTDAILKYLPPAST